MCVCVSVRVQQMQLEAGGDFSPRCGQGDRVVSDGEVGGHHGGGQVCANESRKLFLTGTLII